jgi:polyketide cyclase/dehydrase/lipid transport protein
MQTFDHDEVRLVMAAAPQDVYELIADVTRMSEFSPEIVSCRWVRGATGPAVGARFLARNKFARGPATFNLPVITALDPGRRVSWSRREPFGGTVEWTYEFLPHADGTEVVESYRALKPVSRTGWLIIGTMASKDRKGQQRAGMEETLQRIKAHVESTKPSAASTG